MKEIPIIFNGPMVRAIKRGQKTQTRRVLKPQPKTNFVGKLFTTLGFPASEDWMWAGFGNPESPRMYKLPHGKPGDLLWVRETWRLWEGRAFDGFEPLDPNILEGSLKGYDIEWLKSRPIEYRADSLDEGPWRPSIFMPKWATRSWLEVVGKKVEKVQDISEADAWAEGVERPDRVTPLSEMHKAGRVAFRSLWDSINKKRGFGWKENPWVEVTEFITTEKDHAKLLMP